MKKVVLILIVIAAAAGAFYFVKCRNVSYKDGVYEASHVGNFGETKVKLTLKDNKIIACDLTMFDKQGRVKDENYGKDHGEKGRLLGQVIARAAKEYPEMLIKAGSVEEFNKLDAISGATVTFKEFALTAQEALDKAK